MIRCRRGARSGPLNWLLAHCSDSAYTGCTRPHCTPPSRRCPGSSSAGRSCRTTHNCHINCNSSCHNPDHLGCNCCSPGRRLGRRPSRRSRSSSTDRTALRCNFDHSSSCSDRLDSPRFPVRCTRNFGHSCCSRLDCNFHNHSPSHHSNNLHTVNYPPHHCHR